MYRFFARRPVRVVGVVALLIVVVALLFLFLNWYIAPTKPGERKDLVLALAQILGGAALLSGLYFTWRTVQVNREGQITERFTRAIDQLGKVEDGQKLFEIRTGGIYALERIARESEEDYWPIMEILTAYVRQHAPWPPEENQQAEEVAAAEKKAEESSEESRPLRPSFGAEAPSPDPDIQAIMTVLRRRTRFFNQGEPERLDLRETNLPGADLSGANLRGALLSKANLFRASLTGAELSGASLTGADLSGANLSGANLFRALLSGASLWEALLSGANLSGAHLSGANLRGALLWGTVLWEAELSGANLSGAELSGAELLRADLSGAHLAEARNLTQEQLEATRSGDQNTKLPPHLKPPAHWGVKTDEQPEEN